jgi:hypothetical protein
MYKECKEGKGVKKVMGYLKLGRRRRRKPKKEKKMSTTTINELNLTVLITLKFTIHSSSSLSCHHDHHPPHPHR